MPATDDITIRQKVVQALIDNGLQVPEFSSEQSFRMLANGEFALSEPEKNRDGDPNRAIEINPILWQKRLVPQLAQSNQA